MKTNDCREFRGTVELRDGQWTYVVRLPGAPQAGEYPLAENEEPLGADLPRERALSAAVRMWKKATRQDLPAPGTITVDALCDAYMRHAAIYYRHGTKGEAATCLSALKTWRELHGARPVAELVHTDMLAVRDALIRRGLSRVTVNRYMGIVAHRVLPWACDEGLVRPAVAVELSHVQPLKAYRSVAHETAPVRPVDDAIVEATVAHMMPSTADMVRVHRLTGMRPEEVCELRWRDIDMSVTPWVYRPVRHKNEWRGHPRAVCIGPRARAILERHRGAEYPFSPVAAVAEWNAAKRAAATSPARYCRARADAVRVPRDHWDTCSYTKTIKAACRRAHIAPWGANRLRHAFATDVRRRFGLEATRAVLGHSMGARITDRYSFEAAEDEIIRAASEAVEALG